MPAVQRTAPTTASGTTSGAGTTQDPSVGRNFPCDGCGAKLTFHIGQQSLKCPYCGNEKPLEIPEGAEVKEQDLGGTLEKQIAKRQQSAGASLTAEVKCRSCGGTTQFTGTLTSSECPWCGSPLQRDQIHQSPDRVPVDGVLPFLVDKDSAAKSLAQWVGSRWFAPNEFKRRGVNGVFSGTYLPYWTFDAMTSSRYTGERGDHYYVDVGQGQNRRRERRTQWKRVGGSFQSFFDDVLVIASTGLPAKLLYALEPWPMQRVIPFSAQVLSGYLARTYDVEIDAALVAAKKRMQDQIHAEARSLIGGDEQRLHAVHTMHSGLSYKHLLLPVWLLTYRYGDKPYQLAVNAATGEVQGERPYSAAKIMALVITIVLLLGGLMVWKGLSGGE